MSNEGIKALDRIRGSAEWLLLLANTKIDPDKMKEQVCAIQDEMIDVAESIKRLCMEVEQGNMNRTDEMIQLVNGIRKENDKILYVSIDKDSEISVGFDSPPDRDAE